MTKLRAVKGMHDLLPEQAPAWRRVEETFRDWAERYGYGELRTPVVEPTELFVRSIGQATDIVEKEMYTFRDKGDAWLTLRPEGTASAVRAYLQHAIHAREPVTRWFYMGPMFRRERPAKGRYRQFHQLGVECFGDPTPYADAEVVALASRFLEALGIRSVSLRLGTLGGPESRKAWKAALREYYRPHLEELCDDCRRRFEDNPLRLLDCKVPRDAERAQAAPRALDHLLPEDLEHFESLCSTLDRLGIRYDVDPHLARGLDYYGRTVFELHGSGEGLGAQSALGGGGRYDRLVERFGGPTTPAVGFAMGLERLLLAMPSAPRARPADAFVVAASPALRERAALLAHQLRGQGLRIETDLRGGSLRSQLRRADRSGARFALLLGEAEVARGTVQVKDLRGGSETEQVPFGELPERLGTTVAAAPPPPDP